MLVFIFLIIDLFDHRLIYLMNGLNQEIKYLDFIQFIKIFIFNFKKLFFFNYEIYNFKNLVVLVEHYFILIILTFLFFKLYKKKEFLNLYLSIMLLLLMLGGVSFFLINDYGNIIRFKTTVFICEIIWIYLSSNFTKKKVT